MQFFVSNLTFLCSSNNIHLAIDAEVYIIAQLTSQLASRSRIIVALLLHVNLTIRSINSGTVASLALECHIAQAHIQALGEVTVIEMKTAMVEVVEGEMNMTTEGGAVAEAVIVTGTMIHMEGIESETGTVITMDPVTGMDLKSVKLMDLKIGILMGLREVIVIHLREVIIMAQGEVIDMTSMRVVLQVIVTVIEDMMMMIVILPGEGELLPWSIKI